MWYATMCGEARACDGRASEYELYHAFASSRFPLKVRTRALPFAVVADIQATMDDPPAGVAFAVAHSHLRGLDVAVSWRAQQTQHPQFGSESDLQDRVGIINGNTEGEIVRRLAGQYMDEESASELGALLQASGMLPKKSRGKGTKAVSQLTNSPGRNGQPSAWPNCWTSAAVGSKGGCGEQTVHVIRYVAMR
ncbi:unnamed protein product [Symbiodinium sp. CCMP2592]|nr:unnamed protein product [Symbiodinium sp. CCMP2592]